MKKGKDVFDLRKNPVLVVVFVFLLIRFFLNLDFIFSFSYLSVSFAVIYLILIMMFLTESRFFSESLILFLVVDSIIGIYFFTSGVLGNIGFYGTMLVNIGIIFLVAKNKNSL